MADIRGSIVLDEDDENLVLAVPKGDQRAPAQAPGGIPYRPGDPQGPALEPVNNAEMYFDPNPRKMPVPGEVPDAQMQADIEDFTKLTGKAPQTRLDTRAGAGTGTPGAPGAGPAVPRGTGKTTAGPMPTEVPFEDPNALAGQSAGMVTGAASAQKSAAGQMGVAEAAQIAGEAQSKQFLADELAKQQKEAEDSLKALQDLEAERQAAFEQDQTSSRQGLGLGERFMWALATFMAGVGGKGETVMAMLTKQLDREAEMEAKRVVASRAAQGKPSPNAVEMRQIQANIRDLKYRKAVAQADKLAKQAATPVAAARAQVAKAAIEQKKADNLVDINKTLYVNREKQREEKQQVIGLTGQDPNARIPITAYKSKADADRAISIPGAFTVINGARVPLTYRVQVGDGTDAKNIRDQLTSSRKMLKLAGEVKALNEKSGLLELARMPTKLRYQAESKIKQMQAIKKDLLRLGQLTDSDYAFLEAIIPSKINNITGELAPKMDTLMQGTKDEAFQLLETYGVPKDPALITPAR